MIKRLIDISVSLTMLIVLSPLLCIIALLISIDSPGFPFFSQPRVGKDGHLFNMVKFRSMVRDASKVGSFRTAANDARITRIGRFLRRTSLDELPQLWNVLIGDMSLIGPRPDTPMQEADYTPEQWHKRCSVRPGVTGLAQVMGRSGLNHEQRLQYDLRYAAAPTLKTDLFIFIRTLSIVLKRVGTN